MRADLDELGAGGHAVGIPSSELVGGVYCFGVLAESSVHWRGLAHVLKASVLQVLQCWLHMQWLERGGEGEFCQWGNAV